VLATPLSILITDDDRVLRETLRDIFAPRGFRTLLACDGEEALQILAAHDVHVLLSDMHMPKLTGLEMIRLARKIRNRLPCILMSADADADLVAQAMTVEAYSVLSKPVSQHLITTTVDNAVRAAYHSA
jgi:DNA-binding NtrC family response regulator